MTLPVRILRAVCFSAVAVFLVLLASIQFQQHLLRHRAERLLADFQTIRLHQSTWADAQALMMHWGAWGHYDGECSSSDCAYTITLADPISGLFRQMLSRQMKSDTGWWWLMHLARGYMFLGGKIVTFRVNFLVQDTTVWRSGVWLNLEVPPGANKAVSYEGDYSLLISARASDSLRETRRGPWILGSDDQLAIHPNYKEGRPSGCENCMSAEVTFTPYISDAELRQVTSYDLSCLTRFKACVDLPSVLPIAREWDRPDSSAQHAPPEQCEIPISVRARDADDVLLVEALPAGAVKESHADVPSRRNYRITNLRVIQPLKGKFAAGDLLGIVSVASRSSYVDSYFERPYEPVEAGKRYIIFPDPVSDESRVGLDFCSVVDDSPTVRSQVQLGLSQNDVLRKPEEFGGKFW